MDLAERLIEKGSLEKEEYADLLLNMNERQAGKLCVEAARIRKQYYGRGIYVRGLIEFTNYCKNNCYYCGIRAGNTEAVRYRLTEEEILSCCGQGYSAGFRTFVLQGGEDGYFTDEKITRLILQIKERYPDCALTLSIGEKPYETYKKWKEAGADRYLLRHETADEDHYRFLHPDNQTLSERKRCLYDLKELGYQVGAGFMVGSPGQTEEHLAEDLCFLKELNPQMCGIGPFIPHHSTRFAAFKKGSTKKTLLLLSIVRILLPKVLLPATTALGTAQENGRELGILAGANVIMPNLSPPVHRKHYELYDNKLCGDIRNQNMELERSLAAIGYQINYGRGDALE